MQKSEIGHLACPCCDEPAKIREAKNGRAYILCTSPVCGFQGFTRSTDADTKLRQKIKPIPQPQAPITPPPAEAPKKKGFFDDLI